MFWIGLAIIIVGYLISKAIASRSKKGGDIIYTKKHIKQLTEYGDKYYDEAKVNLENSISEETIVGAGKWQISYSDDPEIYLFDESKVKREERIKNMIKQLETSLAMKEKFIRLEEKYKYSPISEKGFIYQDWADYARYFINYAVEYFFLALRIEKFDHTNYKSKLRDPGTYAIETREANVKLSEIRENQIKMNEIEKRFQRRLKQA
jgi:hypothetical protein